MVSYRNASVHRLSISMTDAACGHENELRKLERAGWGGGVGNGVCLTASASAVDRCDGVTHRSWQVRLIN